MSRPSVPIIVVGLIGLAAIAAAFASANRARAKQLRPAPAAASARRAAPAPAPTPSETKAAPRPIVYGIAEVRPGRSIELHAKPGGRVVAQVGARTEFGSRTALSVARTRGDWLGVTSTRL